MAQKLLIVLIFTISIFYYYYYQEQVKPKNQIDFLHLQSQVIQFLFIIF